MVHFVEAKNNGLVGDKEIPFSRFDNIAVPGKSLVVIIGIVVGNIARVKIAFIMSD